jgi:mannose-6-phosphate isomerase-like protein (cupin superfamily)
MKAGKVWGSTTLLLKTPLIEIHRLEIEANRRCSMHKHEFKWNCFIPITGRLTIEVEKNDYALTDKTTIGPGELMTVKPNEFHRFVSGDEAVSALEIYYPEFLSEDIVRKDCGGATQVMGFDIVVSNDPAASWSLK